MIVGMIIIIPKIVKIARKIGKKTTNNRRMGFLYFSIGFRRVAHHTKPVKDPVGKQAQPSESNTIRTVLKSDRVLLFVRRAMSNKKIMIAPTANSSARDIKYFLAKFFLSILLDYHNLFAFATRKAEGKSQPPSVSLLYGFLRDMS